MSTPAQILANRQNAGKSTGPKTPDGKATVGRNATSHGLSGRFSVLPHESREEYDSLAVRLAAEHAPEGETQAFLVERMVQARWKLARLERLAFLAMEETITAPDTPQDPDARLLETLSRGGNVLEKLERYQAATERSFYKALRELRTLQKECKQAGTKSFNALFANFSKVEAPTPAQYEAFETAVLNGLKTPVQNKPNPASARPVLTEEERAHPALRL